MNGPTCIRFAEIARTVNPEGVPELQVHLGSCPSCQAQWAATKQAIAAARQIPYEAPGPEDRMKIRNALMFNVGRPGQRTTSRRWVQAAAGVAVILGAAGVFAAVNTVVIPWLKVRNQPTVERKAPALVVQKPEPAIVPLPSIDDSIAKPLLKGSDRGVRRPAPVHKAQAPAPAVEPPAVPAPAPEARTPSAAEQAYAEGWEAMRASHYARAAEAMKRAAEVSPSSTLAADARYWEAVALARQGQSGKARAAMESFLRRYPGSPRLGEVSVMLGWILVESQEWPRADQLFRSAENDRAPSVRDSARKGLEIVARVQARTKPAP
jgi:TolA-binding protein